jgi:hypothetical protein
MWEFFAFVLFGIVTFIVGGCLIASAWEKRAVESGRFEYKDRWYRVTKIEE